MDPPINFHDKSLDDHAKHFHLHDGRSLASLRELADYIRAAPHHEFVHHVNDERYDFANWVEHCFDEGLLAKALREAHDRSAAYQAMLTYFLQGSQARTRNLAHPDGGDGKKSAEADPSAGVAHPSRQSLDEPHEPEPIEAGEGPKQQERTPSQPTHEGQDRPPSHDDPLSGESSGEPIEPEAMPEQHSPAASEQELEPSRLLAEHEELTKRSDTIMERYDEKLQHISDKLESPPSESYEKRVEQLALGIEELEQQISAQRKEGLDPFIPQVTLRMAKSRLNVAKATEADEDFDAVDDLLKEVRNELEEVRDEVRIDVRAEVARMAGE